MFGCVSKGGEAEGFGTSGGEPKGSSEFSEEVSSTTAGAASKRIKLKVANIGVPAYGCCLKIPCYSAPHNEFTLVTM
jgi:hypothetical protein